MTYLLQLQPSRMRQQLLWAGYGAVVVALACMPWQPWWPQSLLALIAIYPWVAALVQPQSVMQLQWRQGYWHHLRLGHARLSPRSRISRHCAVCFWQQGTRHRLEVLWRDQLSETQWRCFARQLRLTQWQQAKQTPTTKQVN